VSLALAPCTVAQANDYVQAIHRHNGRLPTAKFSVLVYESEDLTVRGVAIAGLPKARLLTKAGTLEVSRVATDGSQNVCSMLYGACTRAARALGYRKLITYTLEREAGASLRASGWKVADSVSGRSWSRRNAHIAGYADKHDTGDKWRWEIDLADPLPELIWPDLGTQQPVLDFGSAS
jgi:hypothetical protein